MQIPHNALVAVADGAKFLLFRNEGDGAHIDLKVAHHDERDSRSTAELGTDEPGSTFSGGGLSNARSAYENTDFKQEAETNFAADAVDLLNRLALEGWYDSLVIVAAPKTLGAIRPRYHKQLEAKLLTEIAKDLAHAPTSDIEQALMRHEA